MSFIEVEELTKYYVTEYRKTRAINNISFKIEEGDFVAIKGKSGSGKSTLLNLIAGLIIPDKGNIFIDKQEITQLNKKCMNAFRRCNIGFVFQSFELLPYHNVLENILIPLNINHMTVDMNKVESLLHEFDIYKIKDAFPSELSGGEQQRVAITRAIIHNPKLLLLDEPTGNLDIENTKIFLNCLNNIHEIKKPTILLVTHDEEVANVAHKHLILKDGFIQSYH